MTERGPRRVTTDFSRLEYFMTKTWEVVEFTFPADKPAGEYGHVWIRNEDGNQLMVAVTQVGWDEEGGERVVELEAGDIVEPVVARMGNIYEDRLDNDRAPLRYGVKFRPVVPEATEEEILWIKAEIEKWLE